MEAVDLFTLNTHTDHSQHAQKSLDPEIAKELNERQARMVGIQSSLQSGDIRGGCVAFSFFVSHSIALSNWIDHISHTGCIGFN